MAEHPKTPNSSKRRDMYKKTTPSWKDAYRKRCFDRLRGSRESLLQRFRGCADPTSPSAMPVGPSARISSPGSPAPGMFVSHIMDEEWKLLRQEEPSFGLIEDEMDLREELQEELMKEEMSIIAEYEASHRLEEAQVQAAVDNFTSDSVMCPLCQRNLLLMNKGVVFCACGLRIDTEQDGFNLKNVAENIEHGVREHNTVCPSTPSFASMELEGMHNLIMSCEACGFLHIVI